MNLFSTLRRIAALTAATTLLATALASAAPPRDPGTREGPPDDDDTVQMKKLIANPAIAAKLNAVRKFGLDPSDPTLAKKLVALARQQQQLHLSQGGASVGAATIHTWSLPPPHGTAYHFTAGRKPDSIPDDTDPETPTGKKAAPKRGLAGGSSGALTSSPSAALLINGAPPSGTAQAGPGDVLTLTGARLAPGGIPGAISLNLGTCGITTLKSGGVNINGDGTQSVFVILPDLPNAILSDKALTPATITVGSTTFNLTYQAPLAHLTVGFQVGSWRVSGTMMRGEHRDPSPLGFKEGVNANTASGGADRWQLIGLGTGGDDRLGVGVHVLHGFTVSAVRASVVEGGSAANVQVTQAPSGGAQTLETAVHWGIGPTFFDNDGHNAYMIQWDLMGPLGARPVDTLPSYGPCDVKRP